MDREDKILEASVETLTSRCQDLKSSISAFILKLETEYENMNWPSFLDNFALISGQINNMMKVIKSERTPSYRNRILLPLMLSPERDDELVKLTEGRVQAFNHDMCPDYLRTKPVPEVELKDKKIQEKLDKIPIENANKLINNSNKIVNKLTDLIKSQRDSWGNDSLHTITQINQTSNLADTNAIIAAISNGKGIIEVAESPKTPQTVPQTQIPRTSNKVPGTIKTNIKSGGSSSMYGR